MAIRLLAGLSAYAPAATLTSSAPETTGSSPMETYVPGMGEIMAATQMRHSKLWFAGKSGNWELAAYELDELKEGFDDAIKFHPVFKKGAAIATTLGKFTTRPLDELALAIDKNNRRKFISAFDDLTGACNGCHQAAGQGFIVIKRPGTMPFSNQEFSVRQQ